MLKKSIGTAYYFIIPLLILGLSQGYTTFPVTVLALLPLVFLTERHTVGLFFLMYGGPVGGIIRAMYPSIPIYGLLLQLIGVILMWDLVSDLFRKSGRSLLGMLLILAVFGFFYLIGPRDAAAQEKFTLMITHGLTMVLGYYAFCRSKRLDVEGLARILLIAALCMYAFCVDFYHLNPGVLTDYNWFREQSMAYYYSMDHEHMLVGYQHIGMLILYAASIYLSQLELKRGGAIFYALCAFQMVMVSGCRQAIFGFFIVVAMRLTIFRASNLQKKGNLGKLLWSAVGLMVVLLFMLVILENSSSSVVTDTLAEGDTGRQLLTLQALNIFQNNPLTGAGIGGFQAITGEGWPHNFFLELLCETGLLGTLVLLIITIATLVKKKAGLMYLTESKLFYFLILFALFFRVMVSSDLTESIELFSAVVAITPFAGKRLQERSVYAVK